MAFGEQASSLFVESFDKALPELLAQ